MSELTPWATVIQMMKFWWTEWIGINLYQYCMWLVGFVKTRPKVYRFGLRDKQKETKKKKKNKEKKKNKKKKEKKEKKGKNRKKRKK